MIRRVFHQCKADITRIAPQLDVDGFLFGHGQEADCHRLSILPVHTIGHQYADGRVRRFILAEPIGFDGQISALLKGNLDQEKLVADDPDKTVVAKIFSISAFSKFTHPYYIKPARTWATVSPVLLPGFDRRESKKGATASVVQAQYKRAVGLVHKALRQAGIVAEVKSIELSPLSWWPNLPHARDYVPRDKLGSAPRYHVKITFEQPFYGPFSLGRQRHMGFGVFAVLPDSKEDEDASKCNSYGGRCIND
jgi:CRISPR-associated protein Csb2